MAALPTEQTNRFRPWTRSFPHFDSMRGATAVSFSRETGERQTETLGGQAFEFPVTEEFTADLTGYALPSDDLMAFPTCFTSSRQPAYALLPAGIEIQLAAPADSDVMVWDISPISFSSDGRRALFYVENYCGGLCAGGGYLLFELRDGVWREIGYRMVWVS